MTVKKKKLISISIFNYSHMESLIIRTAIVYVFILIILRVAGKRTLSEMTTFDLVLLLVISEATQQALINDDHSILGSMLVITTLVLMDILASVFSSKFKTFDDVVNGVPMIILDNGVLLEDRMKKARVSVEDILEAARSTRGIERLDQIKYAVLEKDGGISIIPYYIEKISSDYQQSTT